MVVSSQAFQFIKQHFSLLGLFESFLFLNRRIKDGLLDMGVDLQFRISLCRLDLIGDYVKPVSGKK